MKTKKILIGGFDSPVPYWCSLCRNILLLIDLYPQFHPSKQLIFISTKTIHRIPYITRQKNRDIRRVFQAFSGWLNGVTTIQTSTPDAMPSVQKESVYHVFSRLYRGYQEPINLTISNVRTLDRLARSVGKQLMIDSTEIAAISQRLAISKENGIYKGNNGQPFIP